MDAAPQAFINCRNEGGREGQAKLSTKDRVWSFAGMSWGWEEEVFRPPLSARAKSDTSKDWAIWVAARIADVLGVKNKFYCYMIGKRKKADRVRWNGDTEPWGLCEVWFLSQRPWYDDSAIPPCFACFSSPKGHIKWKDVSPRSTLPGDIVPGPRFIAEEAAAAGEASHQRPQWIL